MLMVGEQPAFKRQRRGNPASQDGDGRRYSGRKVKFQKASMQVPSSWTRATHSPPIAKICYHTLFE